MADAPRLLTIRGVEKLQLLVNTVQQYTYASENSPSAEEHRLADALGNALHTLRAAWGERDDARRQLYTQAEQREITDALTKLREQRDAARAALRDHALEDGPGVIIALTLEEWRHALGEPEGPGTERA